MVLQPQTNPNQKSSLRDQDAFVQPRQNKFGAPFWFTFGILLATWLLLSGKFDFFHLSLGVLACLLVAYFSSDLMFASSELHGLPRMWSRFVRYIPWLLYQVLLANIHVMYLVCHPRMMELIDPHFVRFKSKLDSDLALVTLANSITLTPGTITVYASIYGDLTVHAINIQSAQSLPGVMEAKIEAVFAE